MTSQPPGTRGMSDNCARLSRNPKKNFFLSVNYLTLPNRFLNDAALRVRASGAHLTNTG